MKRTILIIGAVIVAALCAVYVAVRGGNETVIINPEYDNTNADYFLLYKIERADTATVLYAGVYNLPKYWVSLSSDIKLKDSKGKTYKLLRCNGFDLDKKVFMPESGSMEFALYFEPVDKSEKEVDIVDLDENKETIPGVKLYNVKHDKPVQCVLKGEVINRPQSSRIALMKVRDDFRTAKVTCLPVRDGKFEYTLYADVEEAYQLVFYDEILHGSWRSVDFIAESGTCCFTLNSEDKWRDNTISGGKYTGAYLSVIDSLQTQMKTSLMPIEKQLRILYEEKKFHSPEVNAIFDEINSLSDNDPKRQSLFNQLYELQDKGADKTQEAKDLENEHARIRKTMYVDKLIEYAKEHVDITGYTFLHEQISMAKQNDIDPATMFAVFHEVYEPKYPNHPYTATIKSDIQAAAIAVGKPCPDIIVDDTAGNQVHPTELIKGKTAIIHLWASWCGPCRRHGKELIPIYEKYKDKDVIVVSIAREQNRDSMIAAAKQDGYPWTTFLELNDRNSVWRTFGVGNAGGGDFLIDAQGNFLAVNTSPKEIKEILQTQFE